MKYCYHCGKFTAGEARYCGTCARTYDLRLCPRHHVNPRGATVCSECGSRELSTPQPRIPPVVKLFALLTRLGLGLLLFYATLMVGISLIETPQVRRLLVALAMLLAVLWWLWTRLPDWFQEAIRSFWVARRRKRDDE